MSERKLEQSERIWRRAEALIPAGTQTLAKGPGQWMRGVAPKYLARGRGAHVWDVDGNEYIDLAMAIGPLSLGYTWPSVDEAIRAQLADGITFSLMHPLEVEVAELLREMVPGAEMVASPRRAATSPARRYAWPAPSPAGTPSSPAGITGGTTGTWPRPTATRASRRPPRACRTPSSTPTGPPWRRPSTTTPRASSWNRWSSSSRRRASWRVCALTRERGALLVFDEMWTGFRVALGGAQQRFGVTADLACFSKAIANGMPLSALTGRAEVMRLCERDVFFFTTFGGEALSLAAARATLREMRASDVPARLEAQGKKLQDGYRSIAREHGMAYTDCIGLPCRTLVTFDASAGEPLVLKSFVQQEMIERGILWGGTHTLSLSHDDADIARVLQAYREVLPLLDEAVRAGDVRARLRGEPLEPVFRRTGNFHTKPRPRP
ncbi:MAG: aminotransferase class III-fold pyridoxal phosphate-dependent enzyme [Polyangiaceae bacterium]